MNKHIVSRSLVAGALACGIVAATPLASGASTTSTTTSSDSGAGFTALKKIVEVELQFRQAQLAKLTGEVNGSITISPSDRAALQVDLAAETSGIDALAAKVPGDTTLAELKADAKSMVDGYRVFVVMSPKTHCTLASDTETYVAQKIQGLEPDLQAAINAAAGRGIDVAPAQAAYEALVSEVVAAQSAVSGVSAGCLATTPSGWPGNGSVFKAARVSLTAGRADLVSARADITTILEDIK